MERGSCGLPGDLLELQQQLTELLAPGCGGSSRGGSRQGSRPVSRGRQAATKPAAIEADAEPVSVSVSASAEGPLVLPAGGAGQDSCGSPRIPAVHWAPENSQGDGVFEPSSSSNSHDGAPADTQV